MSREVISAEKFRADGRRAGDLRKINMELGVVAYVDGSCKFSMGNTQVIASVIGPCDSKQFKGVHSSDSINQASVNVEYSVAPFSSAKRRDGNFISRTHKETALIIQQTFENIIIRRLFPQSHIQINVHLVHSAGGELACAINAVTAALMHATIPMNDIVSAVTSSVVDTIPILDLNSLEKMKAGSQLTLAATALSGDIVTIQSEKRISMDNLSLMTDMAQKGTLAISKIIRAYMREQMKNTVFV